MDFKEKVDDAVTELEQLDEIREKVIKLTRKLNRASGRGISKIVREKKYETYITDARRYMDKLSIHMKELAPATSWNTTISGTEEYAEFEILHAIINSEPLPTPNDLKIPSWIWITAFGDVIGELRRMMISKIIEDDLDQAREYLQLIQKIYETIVGLEFSKSLVSNLRRKIDIARTLMDKSESDFANAVINKRSKTTKH